MSILFTRRIKNLKKCFDSLDSKKRGKIGADQLEDPLIGLGIVETKEQIAEIIDAVDEDKSHSIEFKEFLHIVANKMKKSDVSKELQLKIRNFFLSQYLNRNHRYQKEFR